MMASPVLMLLLWGLCPPPARAGGGAPTSRGGAPVGEGLCIGGGVLLSVACAFLSVTPLYSPSGSHSHRYFSSALSEELPGTPQYTAVGFVDDEPIEAYSSRSRRKEPRAPWMGRVNESDPRYWETETEIARGNEARDRANVKTAMSRLNQTAVPPEVMMFRRKSDAATTLTCYAYGFYPRDIEVKWMRKEAEVDWKTKTILPNTDGTYQIRTTVELPEGDVEKDYKCQVDHIGLKDVITVVYKEESGTWYIWLIVGVIVGGLVSLIAVVVWQRIHSDKGQGTAVTPGSKDYTAVDINGEAGTHSSSNNSLA